MNFAMEREIEIRQNTMAGIDTLRELDIQIRILTELRILNSKIERLIEMQPEC